MRSITEDEDEVEEEKKGIDEEEAGRRIHPEDSLDQFKELPKDVGHWTGCNQGQEFEN